MVLLLIGNVLSVLFKFMNCHQIEDEAYHFYFADEQCYASTWWISLIVLLVIVLIFLTIFIILWRMNPSYRQEKGHVLSGFVSKYILLTSISSNASWISGASVIRQSYCYIADISTQLKNISTETMKSLNVDFKILHDAIFCLIRMQRLM